MSSEEEVPRAGCSRLQRKCVPDCTFAPYFPPHDWARFDVLDSVFGAGNVATFLAEFKPRERARAVGSLVYRATEHQKDPAFGRVSTAAILQNMLEQAKGRAAAARVEFEFHVGRAAASPVAKQMGEARMAATSGLAEVQDDAMREQVRPVAEKDAVVVTGTGVPRGHEQKQPNQQTAQQVLVVSQAEWEQVMMTQQATAAQQRPHGKGLAFPDGRVHDHLSQQTLQQIADAQKATAVDLVAREQEIRPQLVPREQVRQQMAKMGLLLPEMGYDASLGHQFPHQQMAQAQQLAAAEAIAREQKMQDMVTELAAAAAAGLTADQYMRMMTQQPLAGGQQHHVQAEHYAAVGLKRDQNHPDLQQLLSYAAEVAREKELMIMQQQRAAYTHAMAGSRSGATTMLFQPGGSADATSFLVQQQPQPQPQTGNAPGSQEETSLPPLLADLLRQLQNDGGDEGQSSDLSAYFTIPYPDSPPDGR